MRTYLSQIWAKSKYRIRQLIGFYQTKFVILAEEEKRNLIAKYQRQYNLKYFIETGTFLGDTIDALKNTFSYLISIELEESLADKAHNRFRDIDNIKIIKGNSADILPQLMEKYSSSTIYWLDGHYSTSFYIGDEFINTARGDKDTPIIEELDTILSTGFIDKVILIDDARCFNGNGDYPSKKALMKFLKEKGINKKQISIKRDIIRIIPAQGKEVKSITHK